MENKCKRQDEKGANAIRYRLDARHANGYYSYNR